jgi:hypothetical protein
MTIRFNDIHAIRLLARACEIEFVPRLHQCIAEYDAEDILKGGVLFTTYRSGSMAIHTAGARPHWLSKALLYLAFDYPFRQLKVGKLFAQIPERNVKSLRLCQHMGFKIEATLYGVYNYLDGVNGLYVLGLYREDCRFLRMPRPEINYADMARTNMLSNMPTVGPIQ